MKRKAFFLPLLFICQFVLAQKTVTNLHYTFTEYFKSSKKTDTKEKFQFNFNWNPETQIFVGEKTKTEDKDKPKSYPRYIINLKNRTIVVQMERRNEYILEELDSFFNKRKLKLEPLEEEARIIKGFKCKGYTFKKDVGINTPVGPFSGIQEIYTLWVTDELLFNDEFSASMLSMFRTQSAQGADFKGVIVEMGYKISYGDKTWNNLIELDIDKLDQKQEAIKWPWESSDGVAWLESPTTNGSFVLYPGWKTNGGNSGVYRAGDGSIEIMNKRLKALLIEITGQQNPKTKLQYFQNIFGVNAWGG